MIEKVYTGLTGIKIRMLNEKHRCMFKKFVLFLNNHQPFNVYKYSLLPPNECESVSITRLRIWLYRRAKYSKFVTLCNTKFTLYNSFYNHLPTSSSQWMKRKLLRYKIFKWIRTLQSTHLYGDCELDSHS